MAAPSQWFSRAPTSTPKRAVCSRNSSARAGHEAHLQVVDAHVDELAQRRGHLVGATREHPAGQVPARAARRQVDGLDDGADIERCPAAQFLAQLAQPGDLARQVRRRVPWGSQPSPKAAVRRMAAGDEPPIQIGGRGRRAGRGAIPMSLAGKRGPGSSGNSSVKARASAETASSVWRPRSAKSPVRSSYSSGTWPAPDADDEAPAREVVDRRELLRGAQRMTLGEDQHVGEQVGTRRHRGQPAQRGRGVVPDGAHGVGQTAGDRRVVAHPEVEEARLVGHAGRCGRARPGRPPSPSRPRTASTGTGSGAACRRRPRPRGRRARRRQG